MTEPVLSHPVYQNVCGSHHIHVVGVRRLALGRGSGTDMVIQNLEVAVVIFCISWLPL